MTNQHLQNLMQKEVSRKDFLGILGLAAISILGFGHIIQLLTGKSVDWQVGITTHGYSSGAYGGGSKRA
jgi:hypothetical protein